MRSRLSKSEHAYLAQARVCRIGSVDIDGWPHTAPLCPAYDQARRTLYVFTSPGGRTARNLRRRPRATVECDDFYEDLDRAQGLVARARARSIRRGPELERAGRLLKKKFRPYATYDIDYVIALRVEQVTSWGL